MQTWKPADPGFDAVAQSAAADLNALGLTPERLRRAKAQNTPPFYLARYGPKEIIFPQGTQGQYAAFLLSGEVRAYDDRPDLEREPENPEGCWGKDGKVELDRPSSRWYARDDWNEKYTVTTTNNDLASGTDTVRA